MNRSDDFPKGYEDIFNGINSMMKELLLFFIGTSFNIDMNICFKAVNSFISQFYFSLFTHTFAMFLTFVLNFL